MIKDIIIKWTLWIQFCRMEKEKNLFIEYLMEGVPMQPKHARCDLNMYEI